MREDGRGDRERLALLLYFEMFADPPPCLTWRSAMIWDSSFRGGVLQIVLFVNTPLVSRPPKRVCFGSDMKGNNIRFFLFDIDLSPFFIFSAVQISISRQFDQCPSALSLSYFSFSAPPKSVFRQLLCFLATPIWLSVATILRLHTRFLARFRP